MGGYFLKVPTIYLLGMSRVNCFRTHNEFTMYPLGILPFAPSVSQLNSKHIENINLTKLVRHLVQGYNAMCQGAECSFIRDPYSTPLGKVMSDVEVARATWCVRRRRPKGRFVSATSQGSRRQDLNWDPNQE